MVVDWRVVGEDWQRARSFLTRYFAVLVERRAVGEMAIFSQSSTQVTAATGHPIRSSALRPPRPISCPTLVAYNAQPLPFPSTANPNHFFLTLLSLQNHPATATTLYPPAHPHAVLRTPSRARLLLPFPPRRTILTSPQDHANLHLSLILSLHRHPPHNPPFLLQIPRLHNWRSPLVAP